MSRVAVVLGAGGFIGHHLVRRLLSEGYDVHSVDLHKAEWPVEFHFDLTDPKAAYFATEGADEVYQLATDMGGAGYIFTGDHDAQVMTTGALINLNVLKACVAHGVQKVFFSSSACVYNQEYQEHTQEGLNTLHEHMAYPAYPDSEYGWEKLFAERLYLAYARNHPSLQVRIARFHSIVGPECTWRGGREKVFAAMARKVAEAEDGGTIRMWGDGKQTRTFLDVEDCIDGIRLLMQGEHSGPFNLGSEQLLSINELAETFMRVAGKHLAIVHEPGPLGVRGRCSDNTQIRAALGWRRRVPIDRTIKRTYEWVRQQVEASRASS